MPKVVLDTNALLMPFEQRLNIDSQLRELLGDPEVFVPGPVIGELKRSKNKFARAALQLASKYSIQDTNAVGDDSVIELATKLDAFIVTNDRQLIARLRRSRIK